MSNRQFRLAGLLRLRKLQEEQAAAELGRAVGQRERAQSRAHRALRDLQGHTVPEQADISTWRAVMAARSALQQNVVLATTIVAGAEKTVVERDTQWQAARVRTVPLEKLGDKHALRVTQQELRDEQIVLDEAATRRATRPTDEPGGLS